MGQCGCGELVIDEAYKLPDGSVLARQLYRGCDYCFSGPAVSLFLFDSPKSEWLHGVKVQAAPKPDEYGSNGGNGISFGLFEVDDLRASARELDPDGGDLEAYGSIDDWLEDRGLDLIQGAMRLFAKRAERK